MSSPVDGASYAGSCLSVAERLATQAALTKLKLNEQYDQIEFWGKIYGIQRDYLVAAAVVTTNKIVKKFYFSVDGGVSYAKLPAVDEWIVNKSVTVRGQLMGDPAQRYGTTGILTEDEEADLQEQEEQAKQDFEDAQEQAAEDDEEEEEKERPQYVPDASLRRLTEIERLACMVESIDRDTCLVPLSSHYLTPTGDIVQDHKFKGLSASDAKSLANYQLYRDPTDIHTLARVRRMGAANIHDFLDSLNGKSGEWVVHTDDSGLLVSLRSLVWLGYEYKIQAHSSKYDGAYFGLGEKNVDLPFMV